jgi:ATP-dependent DNA helicase RecG
VALGVKYFRKRSRSVFELILDDGTGRLHCRWWNMPFLEGCYAVGQDVMAHGRVTGLKPRTLDHPETEVLEEGEEASIHMDRIVPIYPLTEGLGQRWLRGRIWRVVEALAPSTPEPQPDLLPPELPTRAAALRGLHFPESLEAAEAARRRLAWDEFVDLQIAIRTRRRRLLERAPGWVCGGDNRWMRPFLARLGFALTGAQTAVLREIRQDLVAGRPMRRLIQGDVGSGKTVVAAAAALMVLESGYDVAVMAPTEILARQHGERFGTWLAPLGIPVRLRTGNWKTDFAGEATASGGVPGGPALTVGTHALLEMEFAPDRLGLVVIDEQHKFGVTQREGLVRKGCYPHLLVMTATPIPRTLALTLYGDLDVSIIDRLPPGRGRVRTFVRGPESLPKVWEFVREQVAAGRQAYVVYPRVEDDGAGSVKAVTREFAELSRVLAPHPVGLLHGRLGAAEKDSTMDAFREGRVAVLLATLVIEVGVDVANATVMVIENAEQFGLAQLHQLRGRIGRGGHESYCILVAGKGSPEIRRRLRVLEECADGFAIAEADLELRGPGELLGQAQSGLPPLRFGDLAGDRALLEAARAAVARIPG